MPIKPRVVRNTLSEAEKLMQESTIIVGGQVVQRPTLREAIRRGAQRFGDNVRRR